MVLGMTEIDLKNEFLRLKTGLDQLKTEMATKADKADLLQLKEEFIQLKEELIQSKEELKSYAGVQFEELKHMIQIVIEGFSGHSERLDTHEKRIFNLEQKIPV